MRSLPQMELSVQEPHFVRKSIPKSEILRSHRIYLSLLRFCSANRFTHVPGLLLVSLDTPKENYSLDRAADHIVVFFQHIGKFLLVIIGKIGVGNHNQGYT
jgi:hypothetical protein